MRRTSVDPGSLGKLNKKDSARRQITLPNSGTLAPELSNGQVISDIDIFDGVATHLESKKPDAEAVAVPTGLSTSFGGLNSHATANNDSDQHKTRIAITNLHRKIHQTIELIRTEQNAQAENVNEYLESVKLDKPNLLHTKLAFEKKNQKLAQTILQLQAKLESYEKRLAEVQHHGVSGPKEVLKNVSHGLNGYSSLFDPTETMVTRPAEFASKIKNKIGSVDNVNTGLNDDRKGSFDDIDKMLPGTRHSTDSNVSSAVKEAANNHALNQDQVQTQPRSSSFHSPKGSQAPPKLSLPQTLQELQAENTELRNGIAALKMQVYLDFADLKQTLDMEHEMCHHLEEQLNDITELLQHEMAELKQEISSLEEKVQYTLDDRTRDLHELLESCLNRVTKVELQQHQQLIQSEGFENSNFSIAKIINFILAFLSFSLILLSTLASLVSPFLCTRLRYFLTFCFVMCFTLVWKNWDFVAHIVSVLASTYLLPWLPDAMNSHNNTKS